MANALSDYFGAYDAGYNRMQGMADQLTTRKAGNALASGDYGAAAAAFYKGGMVDQGLGVQKIDQQNQDRAYERGRQEKADARQGRLDEQAATKAKIDELERTLGILAKVPEGQRSAALKSRAQVLAAVGLPAEQLTSLGEQDLTNQALASFGAGLAQEKQKLEFVKGSDGTYTGLDPYTGREVVSGMTPTRDTYKEVNPENDLVRIPGEPASSAPQAGSISGPLAELQGAGVQVTSSYRTPEHNAQVGGKPNSRHTTGQAVDLVPPQGMSMGQLAAAAAQRFPGAVVLNEGDHVHVQWGGKPQGGGAPEVVRAGQPKQKDAPSGYQWTPEGTLAPIPGGPGAAAARKSETDLRKEFNALPDVKDFRQVAASYQSVRAAAANPSAAGDLSMIFAYMKMLDPGSVVREQEFANAQNAAGVPDQVRNAYNRALNGQRLNPNQRQDFMSQAGALYNARKQRFDAVAGEYRGYASGYGIDPDRIVTAERATSSGGGRGQGGFTPAQRQAAQRFKGATGQVGSAQRPYAPRTEQEYAKLPSGAHYIHPNGQIKVKP